MLIKSIAGVTEWIIIYQVDDNYNIQFRKYMCCWTTSMLCEFRDKFNMGLYRFGETKLFSI